MTFAWVHLTNIKGPKGDPVGWEKGIIPFGSDINTWYEAEHDGSWTVNSNAHAATITGLPVQVPGQLLKLPGTGHHIYTAYTENGLEPSIYFRGINSVTSHTWSNWERLNSLGSDLQPRLMASGTNVDFLYGARHGYTYQINTQAVADTITGLPENKPGVFKNFLGTGFQWYMAYGPTPTFWFRGITSVTTKTWSPWVDLNGSGNAPVDVAAQHRVRADMAAKRCGYKIGTAGRAAVMLRFDDYPQDMATNILPVLRANDLTATLALTVKHYEELQPTSWATVQGWSVNDGLSLGGHSWSHSAASKDAELQHEIIESADYFETQMPGIRIDDWFMPGTGAPPYGGYNGVTDQDFYDTTAGRYILGRYGVVHAARAGYRQPAGGAPIGQTHATFETWTVAQFQAEVTAAEAGGYGLSLMAHPANIGLGGYMSLADFTTCMEWLAAEREAGRVLVLSARASLVLDPDSNYRQNLLPGNFATGLSGWSGSGWSVTDGIATSPASTTPLVLALPTSPVAWARGGTRELQAVVKSAAVNTIKIEAIGPGGILNATRTVTIPAGQWVTLRKYFTLPYTGETTVTFRISSTTGVAFDVHQINAYAA